MPLLLHCTGAVLREDGLKPNRAQGCWSASTLAVRMQAGGGRPAVSPGSGRVCAHSRAVCQAGQSGALPAGGGRRLPSCCTALPDHLTGVQELLPGFSGAASGSLGISLATASHACPAVACMVHQLLLDCCRPSSVANTQSSAKHLVKLLSQPSAYCQTSITLCCCSGLCDLDVAAQRPLAAQPYNLAVSSTVTTLPGSVTLTSNPSSC